MKRPIYSLHLLEMSRRLVLCCLWVAIALFCTPVSLSAQEAATKVTLKGTVVDESKQPVLGATVMIKGASKGALTDAKGNFVLEATVKPSDVLVISYLGYVTQNVTIGSKKQFNIVLKEDAAEIEGVVVTGFQNISKTTFTGSSSKLNAADVPVKGVTDVSRMLEGQVAGVSIQNVSGTFGAAPKVRVRGVTSISGENKPLWVIDGVVQEDIVSVSNDDLTSGDPTTLLGSAVAGISASDIESITVLKDASATALYGARAMNGVVVVTTKSGKSGAPRVSYSGNFTINTKPSYSNYDIMNSMDQMSVYAELERKGFLNSDIVNHASSGVYGKMYKLINTWDEAKGDFMLPNTTAAKREFLMKYARANTDWFDILFRNSLQQEHSISVSSGSDKSQSYVSLSFLNDDGWTLADHVNRYTANLRNSYDVAKWLKLGFALNGSVRQQKAPGTQSRKTNTVNGTFERDFDINPFSYALNTSRVLRPYDDEGNLEYFTLNYAPFNIINEINTNKIKLNMIDVKAQFDAGVKLAKGLNYEFTGALRYVKSDREHMIEEGSNQAEAYRADYTSVIRNANRFLYKDPDTPNAEAIIVLPYGGFYNRDEDFMLSYDIRNSFKYNLKKGRHGLNALVGQQIKYADRQKFSNTGYGYMYNEGGTPYIDYKIIKKYVEANNNYYSNSSTRDRFAAFYANLDYAYDERYVVSGTVRYDGSNALGKKATARWLPTWNFSGKWNVMNEHFMEGKANWLDQLSLRASYGLTASMPPTSNSAAIFYNGTTTRPNTSEMESYIELYTLANSELTWEKAYLANFGVDISMFKNRFDIVFDYWRRNSFDLISSIQTSGIGGMLYKNANYADMEAHGYDLAISGVPVKTKSFSWRTNFTIGYSDNKITNSENLPRIIDLVNNNGGNIEGYPVRSLFSIPYVGIDHETGVPSFINESGVVSRRVYYQSTSVKYLKYEGPVDPKYTGGWSNTFKWKNLSANIFFTFQGGNRIRLYSAFKNSYNDLDALPNAFFDRWIMPGDERYTSIASILSYQLSKEISSDYPYNSYNLSTERVANGAFVRLKNVSLTYNFPDKWMKASGFIKNMQLMAAMSNVCMIYADKKLNGQDPEFYNTGGVAQPISRQITFALNIGF